MDEAGLDLGDPSGELGRVGLGQQCLELGDLLVAEDAAVDDALVGGAGRVVDAHALPVAVRSPADRLGGGGEQVQADADKAVELVEQPQLDRGVVAVVERVPAHDVAVLLLDVGVVVRAVGAGAGEEQVPVPRPRR